MICPNCGENNSPGFRFCGMCGTMLETPKKAVPIPSGSPDASRIPDLPMPEFRRTSAPGVDSATPSTRQTSPAATIAGPSLLGLDTPAEERSRENDVSLDSLRERSFSGLDSFYEPEEKGVGARQVLLLLVLLAALGAAGWWAYNNYLGAVSHPPKSATSTPASAPPAENTAAESTPTPTSTLKTDLPVPAASETSSTPAAATQPSTSPASAAQSGAPPSTSAAKAPTANPPAAAHKAAETASASLPKQPTVTAKPIPTRIAPAQAAAQRSNIAEPALTDDNGDAAYRKAEALLYGRGVSANCDDAVKYLKEASAKQNAKARSMFGTMYATGHCVPRDLPTSYSWFALALHVDPNNQILEKDLTAVWNQMTPPERQMATKLKP